MLILRYAPLVGRTLSKLSRHWSQCVDKSELASCGMVGLIDAIEKFDTGRRTKFETYAAIRIQGAMQDHLRSLDWLPRALRQKKRAIEETGHALEIVLGRTPSEAELARAMGVPLCDFHKLLGDIHRGSFVSLESMLRFKDARPQDGGYGDKVALCETLPDPSSGPEQTVLERELRLHLGNAIEALPQRERMVTFLYYFEHMTLRQIGTALGLSEATVCTIHANVLTRLRAVLNVY